MFTAYQLAQRVNTEYPNNGFIFEPDVDHTTKLQEGFIGYINSALLKNTKYILLDDMYEFPTITGQALYDLPLGCEKHNIMEVTREYGMKGGRPLRCRFSRDAEAMDGNRYFNGYGNTIGLFPVPTEDGNKVTIFFKKTPRPVRTKDDPIEVKDRYIDLLVYSIVADMASAGSNPDIEIANNYTLKYNNLLQEAMLDRFKENPFYPKIKDNKRPPVSFLRRGRL
jgi:hypothetical protein